MTLLTDLLRSPDSEFRKIQDFLNLTYTPLLSANTQIHYNPPLSYIVTHQAVLSALFGTKFEAMLDGEGEEEEGEMRVRLGTRKGSEQEKMRKQMRWREKRREMRAKVNERNI